MLKLRPYKKCDAEHIVGWIKNEIEFRKWCADRFEKYPISQEDINEYYEKVAYRDDFYEMTAFNENTIIGHLIMRFLDDNKEIVRLGFVIVNDKERGNGYGKEMLELALKFAFEILKVKKVTLGVFENNQEAYYCYKSVGFKENSNIEYFHILGEDWKCIELETDSVK